MSHSNQVILDISKVLSIWLISFSTYLADMQPLIVACSGLLAIVYTSIKIFKELFPFAKLPKNKKGNIENDNGGSD